MNTKKCWSEYGGIRTLTHCWWECKKLQLLQKTVWQILKRLNPELLYNTAIPFLGIEFLFLTREMKTMSTQNLYINVQVLLCTETCI